ncbi:MAG: anthranilate synthase component I family protein [Myxococcota bacterium]
MFTTPSHLAEQLFQHPEAAAQYALWLDSGSEASSGVHRLTGLPDHVARAHVDALPHRGLGDWLRTQLPPKAGDGALYAVLLAYDAGRNLEELPATATTDPSLPDVIVARYPAWYEAKSEGSPPVLCGDPDAGRRLEAWLTQESDSAAHELPALTLDSSMTQQEHRQALERVLEGISAGSLYQANVARRLSGAMPSDAAPALYKRLRQTNPAPFGALWALNDALWLASNSPECLLTWDPTDNRIHSYPIKGTRPRGATPQEDSALAQDLSNDTKERAEHVMIVDLVRNDLGRVACPGSVSVEELFGVSSWSTVHHMVSDVTAVARQDVDLVDILLALFPGGSITGAPKIAAMKWIEAVEGLRRGFYCGSLGAIGPDGHASFSILIRTCVAAAGQLYYQTGGGIVADSDPSAEWRETEVKARALLRALAQGT